MGVRTMETINVNEICGEYCIAENDVEKLSQEIIKNLENNVKVSLDFSEVNTVLTAFFNGLLSELFTKFDADIIQNFIEFKQPTSESILKRYSKSFNTAKKFFSTEPEVQDQIKAKVNKIFNKEICLNESLSASC
ncbi:DUF4325 domain-containing protein [candidate division KSB1 bacterium]|nr:DUF4325 domain-containing protein [candidate division KSB1 bacterium]